MSSSNFQLKLSQRLRDLTIPRNNQLCLRYLDRPRAALRSVESRHVTEQEREQLRSDLRRILNKETPEMKPTISPVSA
jgi:hypothetical protein